MIKKLLFNNVSGGSEPSGLPVTDGLVLWLDANDMQGTSSDTWTDKSGNGNDGTLYNFDHDGSTNGWINGGLQTSSSKGTYVFADTVTSNYDQQTFIVHLKIQEFTNNWLFTCQKNDGWATRFKQALSSEFYVQADGGALNIDSTTTNVGDKKMISFNYDFTSINGVMKLEGSSGVGRVNGTGITLAARGTTSGATTLIYSVYVYNRKLSLEEVQQIYAYEQSLGRS